LKWRQDSVTGKLVPMDGEAIRRDGGVAIHGAFKAFVSPVDGTIISDNKSLREHNKRNNVIQSAEVDDAFMERKKKERERLYSGEHTTAELRARKEELYNHVIDAERRNRESEIYL
jgi:hypothetical protein